MPAGRAVVHRAASAIGTAVPAGPTATGDADGVGRHGLIERSKRHCARGGDRRKAEANRKGRCSKYFHGLLPFHSNLPRRGGFALTKNCGSPVTGCAALPVTAAPVPVVPMAAMPAPVTAVPTPVATVPSPVPVAAPAYLLGLEALCFIPGGDGRTGSLFCRQPYISRKRMR